MAENKENYSIDSSDSDSSEEEDLRGTDYLQSRGMDIPMAAKIPVVSLLAKE